MTPEAFNAAFDEAQERVRQHRQALATQSFIQVELCRSVGLRCERSGRDKGLWYFPGSEFCYADPREAFAALCEHLARTASSQGEKAVE